MKKILLIILTVLTIFAVGCTDNSIGTEEKVNIVKLTISCDDSEINAGESANITLYVNDKKTDINQINDINFVIIKGWESAEYKNGIIFVKNDAKHGSMIEFYAKAGVITSNTLTILINNEQQVKQEQIAEYERQIDELEKTIDQYNVEKKELQSQFNSAQSNFYNYERYCELNGYMVNGNWKVPSSYDVRIQYDKLYAIMNEFYYKLSDKEYQIVNAQAEISNIRKKIDQLK